MDEVDVVVNFAASKWKLIGISAVAGACASLFTYLAGVTVFEDVKSMTTADIYEVKEGQ